MGNGGKGGGAGVIARSKAAVGGRAQELTDQFEASWRGKVQLAFTDLTEMYNGRRGMYLTNYDGSPIDAASIRNGMRRVAEVSAPIVEGLTEMRATLVTAKAAKSTIQRFDRAIKTVQRMTPKGDSDAEVARIRRAYGGRAAMSTGNKLHRAVSIARYEGLKLFNDIGAKTPPLAGVKVSPLSRRSWATNILARK